MTNEHNDSHTQTEAPAETTPEPVRLKIPRSIAFTIPVMDGSADAEMYLLHDLLTRFQAEGAGALLIAPQTLSPQREVVASGLTLVVEVPDLRPGTLNDITHMARGFMLRLAACKYPDFFPTGCWDVFPQIAGVFSDVTVVEHIETSAYVLRRDVARNECPFSRIMYYRLRADGVFESAEVDLTVKPAPITFSEAPALPPRSRPIAWQY